MADDLVRGRPTEIDAIQGAVTRLARSIGMAAPLNHHDLVRGWPDLPRPFIGSALRAALLE